MSWLAFQKFFATLTICAYRDDLFDVRFEGQFTRHAAQTLQSYYFHLERSSTITLGLFHQRSDRQNSNPEHIQSFVLCDIANHHIGRRRAILCSTRGGYTECTETLPAGAYVLIPFSVSYWHQERKHDDEIKYTLVIHSSIQLDIVVTEELGKLLADCLIANALQHHKVITETNNYALYLSQSRQNHLILIVGENTSTDQILNINIDASESSNIRHSRNSLITLDSIPPKHHQIHLLSEYVQKANQSTNFEYTYLCVHTTGERRPPEPAITRADDIHTLRPILLE